MARLCGAKTRSGKPCRKPPIVGRERCRLHGGLTPRGAASPHYKTGRYSKDMPTQLAARYEQALDGDGEVNILRDNIQLREAFIGQRLADLEDAPDSREVWNKLRTLVNVVERSYKSEDYGGLDVAIKELRTLTDVRLLHIEAVKELKDDLAEQRKDAAAISQIEYKGENAIPVSQLVTLIAAITSLIINTVSDKQEIAKLADGIDNIIRVGGVTQTVERSTD